MRHLRNRLGPLAATGALALALAACGGATDQPAQDQTPAQTAPADDTPADDGEDEAAANPFAQLKTAADAVGYQGSAKALSAGIIEATGMEGSVDQPALQVYANLSQLLQEHVYLAGIAVDSGLTWGLDSPQFEAAAAALDTNSVELADLIGTADESQRDPFLSLWREHIGFFVNYAEGAATDNDELKQQALDSLANYQQQSGAFFNELSGGVIPEDAVVSELQEHVDTLTAAIDAAAAGEASVFENLKESATVVGENGAAKALAGGLAQALELEGDIDSPAAGVYASLSTVLEEHVYLAGVAVKTAYASGLDSPAFEAAAATLDTNSVDLADLVGSVDDSKRDPFLSLWREHIGFFVNYAKGAVTEDDQVKQQALDNLANYRQQAAGFFNELSGGVIAEDAVIASLEEHVATTTAAIDTLATVEYPEG